jgi:Uma2 family endonuclease
MSTTSEDETLALPPASEVYRIPVSLYDRLVDQGGIAEDEPIELLNGVLVRKMPKGPRHDASSSRCRRAIEGLLVAGWHLRVGCAVRIPEYSEPEPDLSIVRGEADDYSERPPEPADVGLIVEIADGSLARDRGEKRDLYASAGIPSYWIVNLVARQVEAHSLPAGGAYPPATIFGEDESIEFVLDGRSLGRIAVSDLLVKQL